MHPKLADIEDRLQILLNQLDTYLEDTYSGHYTLHPNRLARGEAASPSYDGLFSVYAKFSLGYGTASGRGYVLTIDLSTLEYVPFDTRKKIEEDAAMFLNERIPQFFPERELSVVRDKNIYKIAGDLSLGEV